MNFSDLKTGFEKLFYFSTIRIPIVSGTVVLFLILLAWRGNSIPAASLFLNLLDVPSAWGFFIVVLLSILTIWTIFTAARITLLYGNERFKEFPWSIEKELSGYSILVRCLGSILLSLSVVFRTCHNNPLSPALFIAPALIGALAGFALLWIAQGLDLVLRAIFFQSTPKNPTFDQGSILILPSSFFRNRVFDKWLEKKATEPPPKFLDFVFRKIAISLGEGYGKPDGSLHLGHVAASVLMIVAGTVYVFVGYFNAEGTDFPRFVPTLGFVLLLLTLACWFLSGLTFFFDRFRIPVLAPIALWLFCTAWFPGADNIFPLVKSSATISERPPTITDSAREKDNEVWILVAANGGGIQSAAWTAQVLTGLQEKFGENFTGKLKVISAVSGGSVGTMHYVNGFRSTRPREIPQRAMSPSLDKAAWGLVYPDLGRFFIPYRTYKDRGYALEQAWIRNDSQYRQDENPPDLELGLSSWGKDFQDGKKPIVIFNTTIVETGECLPLSTVRLSPDTPSGATQERFIKSLSESAPVNDLKIVTAARLSASFPYVTPAARPDSPKCSLHLVDGGYYDNYGMLSLVEWLDNELRQRKPEKRPKRILVIQIIGDKVYTDEPQESRGWAFQFAAPLKTMFQVRGAGQESHSELEFRLVQDKWRSGNVSIERVKFEFDSKRAQTSPPLSWYLNEREKKAIREEWLCEFKKLAQVQDFLDNRPQK